MKNNQKSKIIDQCISYAKSKMKKEHNSHGWDHIERVVQLVDILAIKENADRFIVKISAILHDIARETENRAKGKICHAQMGSLIAKKFLEKLNLDIDWIEKVSNCIQEHRYRGSNKPSSLESRVLFDADKLDSIGAIGIGRAFVFSGEIGARVHIQELDIKKSKAYSKDDTAYREYRIKLKSVKERMMTKTGKKMAKNRSAFMKSFFTRLEKEAKGNL